MVLRILLTIRYGPYINYKRWRTSAFEQELQNNNQVKTVFPEFALRSSIFQPPKSWYCSSSQNTIRKKALNVLHQQLNWETIFSLQLKEASLFYLEVMIGKRWEASRQKPERRTWRGSQKLEEEMQDLWCYQQGPCERLMHKVGIKSLLLHLQDGRTERKQDFWVFILQKIFISTDCWVCTEQFV